MSLGNKLIRGSILRNLEFIIMVLVTFLMTPFIVHSLGNRLYGFWTLISTFIGYYGLLDFGLTSAIGRFISRGVGRKDENEINRVVSTALFLMVLISFSSSIVTYITISHCHLIIDNIEDVKLFRKIFFVFGVSLAVGFPAKVFEGILYSHIRYDFLTIISVIKIVFVNLFIYLCLVKNYSIVSMAWINVIGSLIQYFLVYTYCRMKYNNVKFQIKFIDQNMIFELFNYSKITFISYIADILRFKIDSVVVAKFVDVSSVASYSIGARLIEYFNQIVQCSLSGIGALFGRHDGSGDRAALLNLFEKSTKVSTSISIFIGFSIIVYGKCFFYRWLGDGFDESYYVAIVLCVSSIFALMQSPSVSLLYAISKHHFYAVINLLEGFVNVIISLLLVVKYGIYGVALGTSISMVIFRVFIQPYYVCKCISYPLSDYIFKILLSTSLKCTFPMLIFYLLITDYISADYLNLFILNAIQFILFMPIFVFFILDKKDRDLLKNFLKFQY